MNAGESVNIGRSRLRDKGYYQEYRGTSYQDERVNSSRDTTHLKTQSKTGTVKRPSEEIHKSRWRRQCASQDRWTAGEIGEGAGNFNNLVQQPDPQTAISTHPTAKERTSFSGRFSNHGKPDTGEAVPLVSGERIQYAVLGIHRPLRENEIKPDPDSEGTRRENPGGFSLIVGSKSLEFRSFIRNCRDIFCDFAVGKDL